jgi:hypothetical protein
VPDPVTRWHTGDVLEGQVFLQVALVFAVIGALGLVLKWAFSRDKEAPNWPADSPSHGQPTWSAVTGWSTTAPPAVDATPTKAPPPNPGPVRTSQPEDYGLLASVAAVDTAEEAARVRSLLANAGIRATTTVGVDGRHRVLVFRAELHRARRVAGGH